MARVHCSLPLELLVPSPSHPAEVFYRPPPQLNPMMWNQRWWWVVVGGISARFMAARGFHLPRHKCLLLTAGGRKMTDYISIPGKAALILHGRRFTPLLGKICCVNRPKKLSERKHPARHAAVSHVFACIHLIANIPFRYFLFSVRCRYREASQTRGALSKKLD